MPTRRVLIVALCAIACVPGRTAVAQNDSPACLVLPVETDLQRTRLGKDVSACAILNGDVIITDQKVDASLLDVNDLRVQLEKCRLPERPAAVITVRYSHRNPPDEVWALISSAIRETGRAAGFTEIRIVSESGNDQTSWEKFVSVLGKAPDGPEPIVVETKTFTAFAVRTRLSRLLTGGADLVVDVKPRFDGNQDPFKSTSVIADIANAVPTINLPVQNKLMFRIHVTAEKGRAAMYRFIQEDSESLAELVGFKTSAIESQFE